MPIDKQVLKKYIEELGLSDALQANLLQELEADDKRATQFVGQRLRQDDYSRKTADLSEQRRQAEETNKTAVGTAVQEYAQKLQEADGKMNKILKDLETERISRATAEQRLQRVKQQYDLSDEDVPITAPAGERQASAEIDLDKKLAEFKTSLSKEIKESFVKEIMPELMSFPQISAIQQDIRAEHFALTGKHLNAKDLGELTAAAAKSGKSLYATWEEKFEIPGIRMTKHDEALTEKNRRDWDDEQKRKASEAALQGVSHPASAGALLSTSPVLRPYADRSKDGPGETGNGADKSSGNGHGEAKPSLSGADRAAIRWTERRNQGVPLGKEAPVK